MDNFQLSDLNLNFEFDFQNEFTPTENRVIDEILSSSLESANLFDTDSQFEGSHTDSSSFFDYLCHDAGPTVDMGALDELSKSQLVPFNNGSNQMEYSAHNYSCGLQGMGTVDLNQEINFDWTTFLDQPQDESSVVDKKSTEIIPSVDSIQSDSNQADDVICDNGFVYQELKTLDVPQMYANLDQTFRLTDLKQIDQRLDYSSLANQRQMDCELKSMKTMKRKLFLMPMQLNQQGTESLRNVATKLESRPLALNSMLNRCDNDDSTLKIVLPSRPRQIKQKSERYLTINEQLQEIYTKEIVLPPIQPNVHKIQRKRKEPLKFDMQKIPIEYAVEVVLTDINQSDIDGMNNNGTIAKKPPGSRKSTNTKPSKRATDEAAGQSKPSRRSTKKIKTP